MASSSPQFFRLLLQRNLEDRKLMIPKNFVKHHGKFLSSSVRLKLPDGMEWKVGVTTAPNGVIWLQKGWHKFTEHYSLEFGSLLVFKLDGSSTFQTTIFDPTGVETEYCCNFTQQFEDEEEEGSDSDSDESTERPFEDEKEEEEEEEEGSDSDESTERPFEDEEEESSDSDESSESFPLLSKKRKKASVPACGQSLKKIKVGNGDSFSIKREPEEDECEPSLKKRMPRDRVGVSRRKQRFANKAKAAQRFSSKSEKPGFSVAMKQSNVKGRFNMIIPKDFAKKYLSEDFGMIELQTVNGKNWPLLYKWSRGNFAAYISSGWKTFVQKNHLKEGDVGVFELLKKYTFSFKLQDVPPSPSPLLKKTASSTSTAKNPFFEVDICFKSYKKAILYIPLPFAKEHFSQEMHSAVLQVWNKQWIVTLKHYQSCVRFSAGWSTFYGDNALNDGDTCLFEMVNQRKCVFQVTIFRKV